MKNIKFILYVYSRSKRLGENIWKKKDFSQ